MRNKLVERRALSRSRSQSGLPLCQPHATMQRVVLFISLLLLELHGSSTAANPGFRTAITTKGLDYACQVAVPILEKELLSLTIPDITGKADTPIGSVDYELKKIQLSDIEVPTSSIKPSSQDGLVVQASGVTLHIYADWQYREDDWPHIEDHGNCDIKVYEVSLEMHIEVTADSTGHAVLYPKYCHLYIDKLEIDFHGGASWLYDLFSSYISDDLKGSIEEQVCSVAVNEIETEANDALASIPVNVEVSSTVEIDFAMIEDPILTTSYMESNHKGEFYNISHPVEAPFTPPPLPPVTGNTSMLYLWFTDYMADTAGFVFQTTGQLQYVITPSMVPPSVPFQLNTSYFRVIVPQLYNKFPNWGMELTLNATKPPLLKLSPSGGNITVFGDILVQVLKPGNTSDKELAFVLGAVVYADAEFYLNSKNSVCGNTTFLKIDLSLVSTNIGQFNVDVLQEAANLLSVLFIIPSINQYANSGVPLPSMDGVSLTNASLKFGEDYVLVAADVVYSS